MHKKLIIFDFDGVLCWINKEQVFEGYRVWIDDFLGKKESYRKFFIDLDSFMAWYNYDIEKNLKIVGCVKKKDIERAHDMFLETICDKKDEIFPWVGDIIKILSKRYKLAILTANSGDRPVKLLGDLTSCFCSIVGREDAPIKPSPEGVYRILRKLGADPVNTVIIGDTIVDVQAGKIAGIRTGVVKWGFGEWNHLLSLDPDYRFKKPKDLLFL